MGRSIYRSRTIFVASILNRHNQRDLERPGSRRSSRDKNGTAVGCARDGCSAHLHLRCLGGLRPQGGRNAVGRIAAAASGGAYEREQTDGDQLRSLSRTKRKKPNTQTKSSVSSGNDSARVRS